ncbi:MAG: hypothetical protein H6Q72_4670 [Firmicutes bacterium]|nr:hypothetical protein [Bacillota bacterium]
MNKGTTTKTIIFMILVMILSFCPNSLFVSAAEPAPGVLILKVDRDDVLQLPARFRTAKDVFQTTPSDGKIPSRKGLEKLNISGSSFYSQLEFVKLLSKLPTNRLVILDLRAESHGYLNGIGVSWYSAYKRANWGKNTAQVEAAERKLLDASLKGVVKLAHLGDDKSIVSENELTVVSATTERDIADLMGVKYVRIPVTDYTKPTDENVDQFLNFYKALPKDAWLHLHCEAGEGRTTIFMAMIDMIHNAKKVSYDDIMIRQWLLGGQDIRTATSKDPWKNDAYKGRAAFTKHFYEYVVENPELSISWTEWAKQHNY